MNETASMVGQRLPGEGFRFHKKADVFVIINFVSLP